MTITAPALASFRSRAAAEVRAEMARQHVSARRMAIDLGEAHTWATRRVSGKIPMSTDDLERIASYLGVSMMTLLGSAIHWEPGPDDGPDGPDALSRAPRSSAYVHAARFARFGRAALAVVTDDDELRNSPTSSVHELPTSA